MTLEDSYNIFKKDLDGEEFDSDDDAILAGNVAYWEILADRDWKFLFKYSTLPAGTLSLSSITNLDKVLKVWCDGTELKKATFENRFDTSKDYWIDIVNNTLVEINSGSLTPNALTVDYKYKPTDLIMSSTPVKDDLMCLAIAYKMELNYLSKDQDLTTYNTTEENYKRIINLLIDYNESL